MNRMRWWGVALLIGAVVLVSGQATAQLPAQQPQESFASAVGYAPDDNPSPTPLGNQRPENGGIYFGTGFLLYRQTNPLKNQLLAKRGFLDVDGSISVSAYGANAGNIPGFNAAAGTFHGSQAPALAVGEASGPDLYQPGYDVHIGYKMSDGSSFEVDWFYLSEHKTFSGATAAAPGGFAGFDLADSFLYSPVYNFPAEYAGAPQKIATGNQFAAYGIWNGASTETIEFIQRTQQYEASYRVPVFESETYRASAIIGPRFFWIWERFKWTATDLDSGGAPTDPQWVGIYSNVVSNRMYGTHVGLDQECYLGHGFAAEMNLQAAAFIDSAKEEAKYELGDKYSPPISKRTKVDWAVVPELSAEVSLLWYPTEGVQLQLGYDAMAFFNTLASVNPVDFNYVGLNPTYEHVFRLYDGIRASISINF